MGMLIEPGNNCPSRGLVDRDLRVSLATSPEAIMKGKRKRLRNVALDFRIHKSIVGVGDNKIDINDGDRITLVYEDDGSWILNVLAPHENGYVVRNDRSQYNAGGVGFRISVNYEQYCSILGRDGGEFVHDAEFDFVGSESNKAYFAPARKAMSFAPSRNGRVSA